MILNKLNNYLIDSFPIENFPFIYVCSHKGLLMGNFKSSLAQPAHDMCHR